MSQPLINGSQIDQPTLTQIDALTLSTRSVGTAANNIIALNGSAQLPAVDGSLLTGLTSGLANIVEDITPQLGGNLDLNGFLINGAPSVALAGAAAATGGNISLTSGAGSSGVGGNITLTGGSGSTTGGNITLTGGVSSSGAGSTVSLTAGAGSTTGGNITLTSGTGSSGAGGTATITGAGGSTGGPIFLLAGNGSSGVGGVIRLRPGKSFFGPSHDVEIAAATSTTTAPRLRFSEAHINGVSTIDLKAPDAVALDRTWTLPSELASTVAGFYLTTNSTGEWSFVQAGRSANFTVATTNATITTLATVSVPVDTVVTATIRAHGFEPATGDTRSEVIHATVKNDSGTSSLVGTPTVAHTAADAGATTWLFTVTADNGADTLHLQVTGEAAHSITWTATIEWAQG
jgi:hypothetical protein